MLMFLSNYSFSSDDVTSFETAISEIPISGMVVSLSSCRVLLCFLYLNSRAVLEHDRCCHLTVAYCSSGKIFLTVVIG